MPGRKIRVDCPVKTRERSGVSRACTTKERLIEAALSLIWECSYRATSVDAICERACVKKGSFYHFFTSKADLAVAALEAQWEQRRPKMEELFAADTPPLERLERYFDHVLEKQAALLRERGRVLGCPLMSIGCEISTQDPAIGAKVCELLARNRAWFEQAVADAAAEGVIRSVDPGATARTLFAFYEGTLAQARIENSLEPIRALKAGALGLLGVDAAAAV